MERLNPSEVLIQHAITENAAGEGVGSWDPQERIGPASLVFSNVCCNNFHNILPFSDWITGQLWEELGDAHLSVSIIVCRVHFVVGV